MSLATPYLACDAVPALRIMDTPKPSEPISRVVRTFTPRGKPRGVRAVIEYWATAADCPGPGDYDHERKQFVTVRLVDLFSGEVSTPVGLETGDHLSCQAPKTKSVPLANR
jgi:hypothetical protein